MNQKPEKLDADWSNQMIERYAPYVEAAGLMADDLDGWDCHDIAGRLIGDTFLLQRGFAQNPHGALPADMILTVLRGLSEPEREALRKRISGKRGDGV